ncbi:MAG: hypothetical protein ABUT39_18410, partial [Acidobacteriota bacterium]
TGSCRLRMFRGKKEDSMVRSNLRRGVTALLFVAALTVAGARPAAAEGFGWRETLDWLARFWGGVTLQVPKLQSSVDATGTEIVPEGGGPTTNGDCGPEIDPDGVPRCKPSGS